MDGPPYPPLPQACQLLGLERVYQPAYQLSLDMFKRLGSSGEIYDVLLSKGDVGGDKYAGTIFRASAVAHSPSPSPAHTKQYSCSRRCGTREARAARHLRHCRPAVSSRLRRRAVTRCSFTPVSVGVHSCRTLVVPYYKHACCTFLLSFL